MQGQQCSDQTRRSSPQQQQQQQQRLHLDEEGLLIAESQTDTAADGSIADGKEHTQPTTHAGDSGEERALASDKGAQVDSDVGDEEDETSEPGADASQKTIGVYAPASSSADAGSGEESDETTTPQAFEDKRPPAHASSVSHHHSAKDSEQQEEEQQEEEQQEEEEEEEEGEQQGEEKEKEESTSDAALLPNTQEDVAGTFT